MHIGGQALASIRIPLHWTAQLSRGPQDEHLLRIGLTLHAKGATHIHRHHPEAQLGDAEQLGNRFFHLVRFLAAGTERVTAIQGIAIGNCRAGLHGIRRGTGIGAGDFRYVRGGGELGVDRVAIAGLDLKTHIAVAFVPNLRGARCQRVDQGHGGQDVVLDIDQLARVFRLGQGFRHHQRHPIAHMTHPVRDQDRLRRTIG